MPEPEVIELDGIQASMPSSIILYTGIREALQTLVGTQEFTLGCAQDRPWIVWYMVHRKSKIEYILLLSILEAKSAAHC